jgi:nucleoside-diphosphate-sugar epimerase
LLEEGQRVTELRRQPPENETGTRVVLGDITDYGCVADAIRGADLVYHLAGVLYRAGAPEELFKRTHVYGTEQVLRAINNETDKALLVHCSTTGVFGNVPVENGRVNLPDEQASHHPTNPYEATKSQAEQVVLAAHRVGRVRAVVVRPGLVYGPGDLHLLGLFKMIDKGWFRMIGAGQNLFHPIFISDMTEAFRRVANTPQAEGRSYNIAATSPVSFRELCDTIALELTGRKVSGPAIPTRVAKMAGYLLEHTPGIGPERAPLTRSRVEFMTSQRAYRVERARQELGFVAQVGLGEGIKQTVEWYRAKGLLH